MICGGCFLLLRYTIIRHWSQHMPWIASYFEPKAKLVVDVHNIDEVLAVLKVCADNKIGVTFRGAGTAVSGQACGEGVLVRLMGPEWTRLEVLDEGKLFLGWEQRYRH